MARRGMAWLGKARQGKTFNNYLMRSNHYEYV